LHELDNLAAFEVDRRNQHDASTIQRVKAF
jgi:hypothetical protein